MKGTFWRKQFGMRSWHYESTSNGSKVKGEKASNVILLRERKDMGKVLVQIRSKEHMPWLALWDPTKLTISPLASKMGD